MARIWDAEVFAAVVQARSISAAARQLGRSQPTVSRQLAALEARLRVRLIERTTRQFRLTTAGQAYFERCKALLGLLQEAEELVSDMSGAVRGRLRVSVPPTYARQRIAPLLPAFLREYPDVRLEMVLSAERADLVGEEFDLVVRLGPLRDSTLACRVLSSERFVLCASPEYLARDGPPKRVAELATRRCLATETSGLRSTWVFLNGRRRRTVEIQPCLVSDDLGLLHRAARAGAGFCVLPEYLVAPDLESGELVSVLPRERLPGFRAYALLPSAQHRPKRVRALVDFLAARLRP